MLVSVRVEVQHSRDSFIWLTHLNNGAFLQYKQKGRGTETNIFLWNLSTRSVAWKENVARNRTLSKSSLLEFFYYFIYLIMPLLFFFKINITFPLINWPKNQGSHKLVFKKLQKLIGNIFFITWHSKMHFSTSDIIFSIGVVSKCFDLPLSPSPSWSESRT